MRKDQQIRVSKLFAQEIRYFKARCIILGKKPPSDAKITEIILKKVDLRKLLNDEIVKL